MVSLMYVLWDGSLDCLYHKITYHRIHRRKVCPEYVVLNGRSTKILSHSFYRTPGKHREKASNQNESFHEFSVVTMRRSSFDIFSMCEPFYLLNGFYHDSTNHSCHWKFFSIFSQNICTCCRRPCPSDRRMRRETHKCLCTVCSWFLPGY